MCLFAAAVLMTFLRTGSPLAATVSDDTFSEARALDDEEETVTEQGVAVVSVVFLGLACAAYQLAFSSTLSLLALDM